ncbi:MAG: hypothetical protein KDD64_00585 [Bdellovibrionales bacterium]|nr:hypothetical protein [Bdellovibrionales bacterium]
MVSRKDFHKVVDLARELVSREASHGESFISALEAYSRAMGSLGDLSEIPDLGREDLETLEDLNQKILSLAQQEKVATSDDLKKLAQKGKGIRKYIDRFPSRMSIRRTKKG